MEPDELPCSRNARPEKALVGRAQSRINQATLEKQVGMERTRTVEEAVLYHFFLSARDFEDPFLLERPPTYFKNLPLKS